VKRQAFERLVEEAVATIPRRFRDAIRNVAVIIEDEPSPELLEEMGIEPPDTLFGLYQGTPLTERQWAHGNDMPDRILVFQRPIEDACEGDEDDIVAEVGMTVIHEFGHYFGLSEEEIEDIEDRYWSGELDPDAPWPGEGESAPEAPAPEDAPGSKDRAR
jgi:predicted Zn-dependent protease with MMP-like domain